MSEIALKILLVSSKPPEHSANLGGDVVKALQKKGCELDYLSLYPSNLRTNFKVYSVFDKKPRTSVQIIQENLSEKAFTYVRAILKPIKNFVRNTVHCFSKSRKLEFIRIKSGFYYNDEFNPDINTRLLLSKIPQDKHYDLIITLFWQNMLNTTSLKALFDRFNCPIYIYSVDMAPITGGCFYFNKCSNYTSECGNCPCLLSSNSSDRSHNNYIVKKNNYSMMKAFYMGNSWMIERAIASNLFDKNSVLNMSIIIDEFTFHPIKILEARKNLELPKDKDLILLARSSDAKRKGSDIIVYAINSLIEKLSDSYRERLCLVTVGDSTLQNKLKGKVCVKNLGLVNRDVLIYAYQSANLFLNPSTDDAGPSMVNQSIMCGTPVVSFNLGTAVDVIENGISGFKTDNIDEENFASILEFAVNAIISSKYPNIRETTREKALKHNTSQVFANKLLNHFFSVKGIC